jgi:outer membrane protein assembly factor BamB
MLRPLVLLILLGLGAGESPVGWRGDGTGKYLVATPPTHWGRVSKPLRGLRYQASRPKPSDSGLAMPDGVIRDWLVLSPAPTGVKVDKEVVPDEATLSPADHEKAGDGQWKKVSVETAWLDFNQLIGKTEKGIGVAATHVFSENGGKFLVHVTQLGPFRLVVNGKSLPPQYGRYTIELAKGWNRLLVKVAPHDTGWACTVNLHARLPAEFEDTHIAWTLSLPGVTGGFYGGGTGCGSPVIVKDRIYLLSEPHDLICINKADGKVLWVRTNSYFDAASAEDKKKPAYAEAEGIAHKLNEVNAALTAGPLAGKQLEEKVKLEGALWAKMQELDPVRYKKWGAPDIGYSGFTPLSDGKFLYLWLGSGVTACYDLDGNRKWIRSDVLPMVEHGFSSSPILVDGKIIVFMRDLFAFDAKTGNQVWRVPLVAHEGLNPAGYFHGTPVRAQIGDASVIVLGNGTILRASDGKALSSNPEIGNQSISSPVVEGAQIFLTTTWSMKLFIQTLPAAAAEPIKLPTQSVSLATPAFPHYYLPWHIASPLVHEGLAYFLNNAGVLTVLDLKENKVLYQKMLDLDGFQTNNEGASRGIGVSPTLAGKYIYLLGNNGGAIVMEPGRSFKQVAKNKIENVVSIGHWGERQERFVSNPVFDGNRMYIRGEGHLYAIASGAASASGKATPPKEAPKATEIATAKPDPVAVPAPAPAPQSSDPDVFPAGYFGWRRNGSGHFADATPPTEWSDKKNIKWQAKVGPGTSSPVIAGERILLTSEPGTVTCVSRGDGKILWSADLKAEGREPQGTKEYTRQTPVTDGKNVFVAFSNGVVASYSLDGKRHWLSKVEPAKLTYGPSASPVLAGGKLLVDGARLTALDPATGKELWKAEVETHYGSPAVFTLNGTLLAVNAKGAIIRISDGAVLAKDIAPGLQGDQSPSPIVQGNTVYFTYLRCCAVKLSMADGKIRTEELWDQDLPGAIIASPILKDGLLYVVPGGQPVYHVLEAATGKVLLEKPLELDPNIYPSLTLAGKYLFLGNDKGTMLVLEPGKEFKQVQKNELADGSGASPVFSGSQLFLRGGEFLYCIGQ